MSAEELSACIQGALLTQGCVKMIPPDNRCCFCLTLRLGVIIIGIVNFALYLFAFSWYIGSVGFTNGFEVEITNTAISVFVLLCVQLLVNLLLIIGAIKRIPNQIFPWLCSNAVVIAIMMVIIFMLVFFGTSGNSLNYQEYVSILSILSLLAGTDMFCCIVVFQFRKNLMIEARMAAEESGNRTSLLSSSAPPPTYEDAAPGMPPYKVPLEDPPPGYEAAMAMSSAVSSGPQLRKKSLTSDQV